MNGGEGPSRPDPLERLLEVARSRAFPGDGETLERLLGYLRRVLEANRRVNLTSARTLDDALTAIGLSALAVTSAWSGPPPRRVADLGTGNGLPGVAAALAWPAAGVVLVERRARKARAVADCLERAGVGNAQVLACDGREVLRIRPDLAGAVDLVTVRAAGPLDETTAVAAPWLAPGGRVAHWKGRSLGREERERGMRTARAAGLEVLDEVRFADDAGPARLVLYARAKG